MSALGDKLVNNFDHDIKFGSDDILNVKYSKYIFAKKGSNEMGIIEADVTYKEQLKTVRLVGKRGMNGVPKQLEFDDMKVNIVYGSKNINLPFSIKLRDFQLDRYPGSMSPSSYASEVTVFEKNSEPYDYRIFMNNTLHIGNYLFFQSSYDPDELGTVLSVNNDPGKWPTYLGYFLLTLGLIVNLFDKKSRFLKLSRYLKNYNTAALSFLAVFALFFTTPSYSETFDEYITKYKEGSKQSAELFGQLVIQSAGRMKPNNSLNIEIVQKLNGSTSMSGLNPDQIVMGMLSRPDLWQNVQMIKIRTPKLKKLLGVDESRKKLAFSELFSGNQYKLEKYVKEASMISPAKRGTFERDVIRVDERVNIAYMTFYGNLFKVFPDHTGKSTQWFNPFEALERGDEQNKQAVRGILGGFINSIGNYEWENGNKYLDLISKYQYAVGKDIIPSKSVMDNEILFNKIDLFPKLTLVYVIVGLIMLVVSFVTIFNKNLQSQKLNIFFFAVLALLFTAQTYAMGLRWYISGHAPWSDTYESLIYIAWSGLLAGVVFFRKNLLALSASVIVATIFMFTAHLSHIDPQITNLVPVLKSYWLTIHVSIITGSYGFLGLGAVLGFMSLLLFIIRDPHHKPHIDDSIRQMTAINEMALIIGLSFLVVGNFLGGVWANESWGRYWGWDPKETWAYVAIVVYILVLHLRFIPKLDNPFVFSTASLLGFSSILMTYFGVNFYLSGMHSYATGDPVPIPTWVYVLTALVFVVIGLASRKRKLERLKV
jgi:cytochrome c-type biogenesis protein CcsB